MIYHSPSNLIFIITSYGALSFDSLSSLSLGLFATKQTDFKERVGIYDVHYDLTRDVIFKINNLQYLFVAAGSEGIDVYKFKDNMLVFITTIL